MSSRKLNILLINPNPTRYGESPVIDPVVKKYFIAKEKIGAEMGDQRTEPNNGLLSIGRQLLRSGISVGANYRAACRARSSADFIAKMGIVEEELDESIYWLELLVDSGIVSSNRIALLTKEADELLAIIVIYTVNRIVKKRKPSRN